MKTKVELIEDWRKAHKLWSVRLSAAGAALLSAFFAFPDAMVHVWNMIPVELKAYIPAEYAKWIPVALIVSGVLARIVKQKGLRNDEPSRDRQDEN